MPKLTKIGGALSPDELEQVYRKADDGVARSQWQIIWLISTGKSVREVTEVTGYSPGWIRQIARRYNADGEAAIGDQRHKNKGGQPLLNQELRAQLYQAVHESQPADGGLWSGPKVVEWVEEKTGRKVTRQAAWRYLVKGNLVQLVPRPAHTKADKEAQAKFKEVELPNKVEEVKKKHPKAKIEVWSQDEHRLGLQPIIRKVWARRGQRPVVSVEPRYEWVYLYGFVCPVSGEVFWLLLPTVNILVFNLALAEFAKAIGAGPDKQIILVLDGAGWHGSPQVVVPTGIELLFLPAYSPELQPTEKLWPLTNEGVANKHFKSLDELEEAQVERCRQLSARPALIKAVTSFQWWSKVAV